MLSDNTLELAITNYLEDNDIAHLQKFVGKCDKEEPFGHKDLAKLINKGDLATAQQMIAELTTFAEAPKKDDDETFTKTLVDIIGKIEKGKKGQGGNNFMKLMKYIIENTSQHKKPTMPKKLANIISADEWKKLVVNCI